MEMTPRKPLNGLAFDLQTFKSKCDKIYVTILSCCNEFFPDLTHVSAVFNCDTCIFVNLKM